MKKIGKFKGIAIHELWLNRRNQIFGEGYDYGREGQA
jgi:hypothetical protein